MDLPEVWKGNRGAFIISRHQIPEKISKLHSMPHCSKFRILQYVPTIQHPPLQRKCSNITPNCKNQQDWIIWTLYQQCDPPGSCLLYLCLLVVRIPPPIRLGKKHWIYYSWRFQIHTCWYMDLMFLSSNLKSHSLSEELSMACLENEQVEHSLWWIIFQNWQVIPILLGL